MKHLRNFLVRSLCAIGAGVLLIQFNNNAIEWFTIACGTLFFISGLISCAFYLGQRTHIGKHQMYDTEGNLVEEKSPVFPLVGIGSIVLGAILVFMRNNFESYGLYVLAGLLILGALSQYLSLARARKYCSIGAFYWIVATILLLIGMIAILKRAWLVEHELTIIGLSFLVYGVLELIVGFQIYRAQRRIEKQLKARLEAQAEAERAQVEDAQAEEITDEEPIVAEEENIEDAVIVDNEETNEHEKINFDTADDEESGDSF